jgi:hypothetical protein
MSTKLGWVPISRVGHIARRRIPGQHRTEEMKMKPRGFVLLIGLALLPVR